MARQGRIKVGKEYQSTWAHDYGGKNNPFTAVKVGGYTRYIDTSDKYSQKSGESIEAYYKRLAKQADQRLVRLEKLAQEEGFSAVTKYAYARAQKDIKQWGGNRFNQNQPKNKQQLKAKIKDIKTFLQSQTSTKSGILKTYKQRAKTINDKYGTSFTWQELATYFESGLADKEDKSLGGSGTRLQAYWQTKQEPNPEAIRQANENHKMMDNPVDEIASKLRAAGYDYQSINRK